MPLVNYCKKCRAETPLGESCPHCGGKLAQTNEQVSFGVVRMPVRDWFAWNNVLRVGLPALLLVLVTAVAAEGVAGGAAGVIALFSQGFFWTLMAVLAVMLLLVLLLLVVQGPERVHYILDRQGVHARTYLAHPGSARLYARFLTPQSLERLKDDDRPPLEGLTLVRRVFLPWAQIRRVRVWREGFTVLFFRPSFWQALALRCPLQDMVEAEAFVRKKLKRFKKVRVLPAETAVEKKKR